MTSSDNLDDILRADRERYFAAIDFPGDSEHAPTYRAQAGKIILDAGLSRDDAERLAVARWRDDNGETEQWGALANAAKASAAARAKLDAHLRSAVDGLLARFPDAEIDVHDGSVWLVDRRMRLPAIETELLVRERLDEAFAAYRAEFDEAIDRAGYRVKLSDDEELRRDNLRAEWGDQIVDVLVPVTHPAVPMTGRVEVVDGCVVIETATRDDLAQQLAGNLADQAQRAAEHTRSAQ